MARIANCKCGLEFYDSTETATLCNRCKAHKAEKEAKIKRLTAFYRKRKAEAKFYIGCAMIQCHWREGLSLSECAKVLGITEEQARFERDIVRQNAR